MDLLQKNILATFCSSDDPIAVTTSCMVSEFLQQSPEVKSWDIARLFSPESTYNAFFSTGRLLGIRGALIASGRR